MMPHPLPTTTPRGNAIISRILIAVDDSEHSARALRYVGSLLREGRDVQVTLFHVLKERPRELVEHGGTNDQAEERRLEPDLQQDQQSWVSAHGVVEDPT